MDIKIIENILELDKIMQENETILIFSTLTSCAPCKKIYPEYEKLSLEYKDKIDLFTKITFDLLDPSEKDILKTKFNITRFPSFVLINNKTILNTIQSSNIEEVKTLIQYI
jgi:desumoylating isopeptidase 1